MQFTWTVNRGNDLRSFARTSLASSRAPAGVVSRKVEGTLRQNWLKAFVAYSCIHHKPASSVINVDRASAPESWTSPDDPATAAAFRQVQTWVPAAPTLPCRGTQIDR